MGACPGRGSRAIFAGGLRWGLEGVERLEAGGGVGPRGGRGSVAATIRAATFPLVLTPRQSALSRALLQPSAWAAAAVARAAGPAPGNRVREAGRPGGCG
jgi:hypothetical protein